MRLVTFRTVNALDEGDFFDGLAPTMTFACAAADNLTQKPGDPDEGLTAAALDWLATGTCGSVITAAGGPLKQADQIATRYPRPARPSAAQVWLPGAQ
jgi:hypothetical protein